MVAVSLELQASQEIGVKRERRAPPASPCPAPQGATAAPDSRASRAPPDLQASLPEEEIASLGSPGGQDRKERGASRERLARKVRKATPASTALEVPTQSQDPKDRLEPPVFPERLALRASKENKDSRDSPAPVAAPAPPAQSDPRGSQGRRVTPATPLWAAI